MFGALHVLREEPTYATALTETDGVAYTLASSSAKPSVGSILAFETAPPRGHPAFGMFVKKLILPTLVLTTQAGEVDLGGSCSQSGKLAL